MSRDLRAVAATAGLIAAGAGLLVASAKVPSRITRDHKKIATELQSNSGDSQDWAYDVIIVGGGGIAFELPHRLKIYQLQVLLAVLLPRGSRKTLIYQSYYWSRGRGMEIELSLVAQPLICTTALVLLSCLSV